MDGTCGVTGTTPRLRPNIKWMQCIRRRVYFETGRVGFSVAVRSIIEDGLALVVDLDHASCYEVQWRLNPPSIILSKIVLNMLRMVLGCREKQQSSLPDSKWCVERWSWAEWPGCWCAQWRAVGHLWTVNKQELRTTRGLLLLSCWENGYQRHQRYTYSWLCSTIPERMSLERRDGLPNWRQRRM